MKLKDKVAIVTGSSRGIGREIALRFAREGAHIVVNCRNTLPKARAVAKEIEALGRKAIVVQADVGTAAGGKKLVSAALKAFKHVDILINNAGIIIERAFVDSTDDDWKRAIHSNLDPFFYVTRAALPHMMKRKKGRVISASSIIADRYDFGGNNMMSACTAAKAAVTAMLRAVAVEAAPYGVTVNAVSPGYIATEMFATLDQKGLKKALQMIPLGRYGTPDDIAAAMVFLASDEASYITGHTLRVNGGMSMN